MKKFLSLGLGLGVLALSGWLYYIHTSKLPPAPKDLTKVFPKRLLEQANPAQLAVLRGEAASAPKASASASRQQGAADLSSAQETAAAAALTPDGLKVALTADQHGSLIGQVQNSNREAVTYVLPAGTLFTNDSGDVVTLRARSVEVPAGGSANLSLPVAQMSSTQGILAGGFTRKAGTLDQPMQFLIGLLSHKHNVSPNVAQTAVLIVNDDVPLDAITSFPRQRPPVLAINGPKPFAVSPSDLVTALTLVREAGIDPAKSALMSEPQLEVMTMLNPESHEAAREFFGLSEQTEWSFWKHQLLEGDPSLRHFALYGIARYYPDVALQMLPRWVREPKVYRNYRISAAWALALIEDPRAQDELRDLRHELQGDVGLRQALDRALQHWTASSNGASKTNAG